MVDITVGQIYECKQRRHPGWKVIVAKVAVNHVELRPMKGNTAARKKAHTTNGLFNVQIDQFRRDFVICNCRT